MQFISFAIYLIYNLSQLQFISFQLFDLHFGFRMEDYESVEDLIQRCTVVKLKEIARKYNVPVSGSKEAIATKLWNAVMATDDEPAYDVGTAEEEEEEMEHPDTTNEEKKDAERESQDARKELTQEARKIELLTDRLLALERILWETNVKQSLVKSEILFLLVHTYKVCIVCILLLE